MNASSILDPGDLLLQPAVAAVATATSLGQQLIDDGWEPQFPEGQRPGTESTADALGADLKVSAAKGLASVSDYLREAHELAVSSVLAPHGTTLPAYRRAYDGLLAFTERW